MYRQEALHPRLNVKRGIFATNGHQFAVFVNKLRHDHANLRVVCKRLNQAVNGRFPNHRVVVQQQNRRIALGQGKLYAPIGATGKAFVAGIFNELHAGQRLPNLGHIVA